MLGKLFSSCDQFGQQVKLSIHNDDEFKTTTGGIMTILAIGLTMLMATGTVSNYLKHEEPAIAFEYDYTPDPGLSPLNSSNYLFSITAQDSDFNISASYLGFNLFQTTIARYPNGSSTKVKTRIPLQRCPLEYWAGFEDDYYLYNISNRLCPTVMDYNITGSYLSVVYTYLSIEVVGCQNRTDQPDIVCLPQETLDAKVPGKEITLSYMYTDNMFNLNDWTNPVKRYVTNLHWVLAPKLLTKETDIFLQQYDIITDDNYFLNGYWVKNESTYQINGVERDQNYAPVKSGGNDVYMKIYLRKSSSSTSATREFSKAADVLSTIGGLAGFLFIVCGFVAMTFNKAFFRVTMANSLYEFDIPEPPKKKPKKAASPVPNRRKRSTIIPQTGKTAQEAFEKLQPQDRMQIYIKSFDKYSKGLEKKMKFSFFDFIMGILSCRTRKKDRLISQATEKLQKDTDIIQILKRLQDLEKLKQFFFNPAQMEIFSYTRPPLITLENNPPIKIASPPSSPTVLASDSPQQGPKRRRFNFRRHTSFFSKKNEDVNSLARFYVLFDAYRKVRKQKSKTSRNLLKLLDAEMEETLYNLDYELKIDQEFSKQYYKIIGVRVIEDLWRKAQRKKRKMTKSEAGEIIAARLSMRYRSRLKAKELTKVKSIQSLDEPKHGESQHDDDVIIEKCERDLPTKRAGTLDDLRDDKERFSIASNGQSEINSPIEINGRRSNQLKGSLIPLDLEAGDSTSRLDLLSTKNEGSLLKMTPARSRSLSNFWIRKPAVSISPLVKNPQITEIES